MVLMTRTLIPTLMIRILILPTPEILMIRVTLVIPVMVPMVVRSSIMVIRFTWGRQ